MQAVTGIYRSPYNSSIKLEKVMKYLLIKFEHTCPDVGRLSTLINFYQPSSTLFINTQYQLSIIIIINIKAEEETPTPRLN